MKDSGLYIAGLTNSKNLQRDNILIMAFQEGLYRNIARGVAAAKATAYTVGSEGLFLGGETARTAGVVYARDHFSDTASPLVTEMVNTLSTLPLERGLGTFGIIYAANAAYEAAKQEPDRLRFFRSVYDFIHPEEAAQRNVDSEAMWGIMGRSLGKRVGRLAAATGAGVVGMQFSSTTDAIAGAVAVGGAFGVRRLIERRKNKVK